MSCSAPPSGFLAAPPNKLPVAAASYFAAAPPNKLGCAGASYLVAAPNKLGCAGASCLAAPPNKLPWAGGLAGFDPNKPDDGASFLAGASAGFAPPKTMFLSPTGGRTVFLSKETPAEPNRLGADEAGGFSEAAVLGAPNRDFEGGLSPAA